MLSQDRRDERQAEKRARTFGAEQLPRTDEGGEIHPLSPTDLTRGFLIHEDQISRLMHQSTLVIKMTASAPLASKLLEATAQWRREHTRGRPHPKGPIYVAVAHQLLSELQESQMPNGVNQNAWSTFMDVLSDLTKKAPPNPILEQELVHCSARLTARRTDVLIEFQPHLMGTLQKHASIYVSAMQLQGGELLGRRPPGTLSRKARGLPITSEQG